MSSSKLFELFPSSSSLQLQLTTTPSKSQDVRTFSLLEPLHPSRTPSRNLLLLHHPHARQRLQGLPGLPRARLSLPLHPHRRPQRQDRRYAFPLRCELIRIIYYPF